MPRAKKVSDDATKAAKPKTAKPKTAKAPKTVKLKASKQKKKESDTEEAYDSTDAISDDDDASVIDEFDPLDIDEVDPEEKAELEEEKNLDNDDAPRKRVLRKSVLDIVDDDNDGDDDGDYDNVEWEDAAYVGDEPVEAIRTIRIVAPDKRITSEMLSGKECGRLIGDRARLLNNGANPYIDNPMSYSNSLSIAREEFLQYKIPMAVIRHIGGNKAERWSLKELSYPADVPEFE